jgi:chromosome partitioning protein
MAKVISICSQKGGVAKTSVTIEIAALFKIRGYKVLVIDFDQQCSLTKNVEGSLAGNTIYSVFHADCTINEAIQHLECFDLIAGSESLSRAGSEFTDDDDITLLKEIVDIVKDDYDFIFVDNGPSRNQLLTMTYVAADYVVIPTECDESSMDGLVTAQNDISILKNSAHKDSHAKIIGYILTKYENTNMHNIAMEDLQALAKKNKDKPFVAKIRKSIKVSEAKTFHEPVVILNRGLPIADDFVNVANEIIKRVGN